jgi:hypothetical protein
MPELTRRRYPERSDELFERATLCGFGEGRARHTLQTARRATLRPHHTPGQPNRSGVEGRRFDRIVHSRTSWPKPADAGRSRAVRLMIDEGWQRGFDDPIEAPDGTRLNSV